MLGFKTFNYLGVDALVGDLPGDLVGPDGVLDGPLAEAEEGADEGQGHGDAEPEGQEGHQGKEGDGRGGALVPQDQVHREEVQEHDSVWSNNLLENPSNERF